MNLINPNEFKFVRRILTCSDELIQRVAMKTREFTPVMKSKKFYVVNKNSTQKNEFSFGTIDEKHNTPLSEFQ